MTLFDRVQARTKISKVELDRIITAFIDEMSWEEIGRWNAEWKKGQLYDDAGGYFARCIGKLFGSRSRHDELRACKDACRRAFIKADGQP